LKKITLLVAFLLFPGLSQAAVDMFLDIEGVAGESVDKVHGDEIDVLAWSWGASSVNNRNLCVQDVSITKFVDASSPVLLMNQVEGVVYPNATLVVRKAGDNPLEYIVLEFRNLYTSSLSTGGSGGEDRLTENVTFNFDDVTYTYTKQNDKGGPGEEIKATISSIRCK
jgi:type VI secretion system secreted protein Hcp